MNDTTNRYLKTVDDLEYITGIAWSMSINTHGRDVNSWRFEYCSYVFGKLCLHANAILQLIPEIDTKERYSKSIWNISSIAVLIRALIETYYVFFYLGVDNVTDEELEFRHRLWKYHGKKERLDMLRIIESTDPVVTKLTKDVEILRDSVITHTLYQSLESSIKKKIRRGEMGILHKNSELSKRAGIDPNYYNSEYKYLSAYAHATPFAYSQLNIFRAGDAASLAVIRTILEVGTAYLCHAVRDFVKIMPDQEKDLDERAKELVDIWDDICRNVTKQNLEEER
ncbi:MAG TPA: DUF5677 domain-containing protein [Thermodesulfobacteriota bacterium]|nr:DUF5677 domain-containing protein [Thermodesulfobacteriota bacterium]